jgi:hypothetical protein
MLCRMALVRTDISEELRVTRIGEIGTMLAVSSSETSVLTRPTLCNIPEDTSLRGHRRESHRSYRYVLSHQFCIPHCLHCTLVSLQIIF